MNPRGRFVGARRRQLLGRRGVTVACAALLFGCGGSVTGGRGIPPPSVDEAQWQDALSPRPQILLALRPKELRADHLYGPLLGRALGLARLESRVAAGTRVLEAIEDAEEVIATVEGQDDDRAEVVAVLRGVRADLDPAALVDAEGRALWSSGPGGRVRELVHERENDTNGAIPAASLFELPGRTWVMASGAAQSRARDAFSHRFVHPASHVHPDVLAGALVVVRIDGPSLASYIRSRLRSPQPSDRLSGILRRMVSLSLQLAPGDDREVRAVLAYEDASSATLAESALGEITTALSQRPTAVGASAWFSWLGTARVRREAGHLSEVRLVATLPPNIIEGLLLPRGAQKEPQIPIPGTPASRTSGGTSGGTRPRSNGDWGGVQPPPRVPSSSHL